MGATVDMDIGLGVGMVGGFIPAKEWIRSVSRGMVLEGPCLLFVGVEVPCVYQVTGWRDGDGVTGSGLSLSLVFDNVYRRM